MEIWKAIVLGFIQGFTEFLPISSSGHLILAEKLFGIKDNLIYFSVMLHIGTLIPVFLILKKEIISLFNKPFNKLLYLIYATIPAGIVGLIFHFTVDLDGLFLNHTWLLGITFILTAIELLYAEKLAKNSKAQKGIDKRTSLFMGFGQAFAVMPGLSRSGTTITFGTKAKVNREDTATFSFLMSIPIILSAVFLEGVSAFKTGELAVPFLPLFFGVLSSALTGYIAIKFMLSIIKKANYKWFSVYLLVVALISFIV